MAGIHHVGRKQKEGKAISDTSFKKRKEALIVLLKALDLVGPLKVVQQHRGDIRAKRDPVLEQRGVGGHDPACHGSIPQ